MTKKIIKVEETKKKEKTSGLDLGKIKGIIDDNPKAVKKITEGLGELLISNATKSTSSKGSKKTTKKNTKKSSASDMTNTIKTISNLLGK